MGKDTWKDPFTSSGWPDGYGANVNWVYVMSQGLVKPGWFGDVRPDSRTRYDPATGLLNFYNATSYDGLINVVLS